MSQVGYVFSGSGNEGSGDFLTWSERDGYRVWIHSKSSTLGRVIISVEIQAVGATSQKPSKEELEEEERRKKVKQLKQEIRELKHEKLQKTLEKLKSRA